jgi:hypothetical protein
MKSSRLLAALAIATALAAPVFAENDERPIDRTAAGVGVTFGNVVFVPFKAISAVWGLGMGGLSFILSGGDTELTRQSWRTIRLGASGLDHPAIAFRSSAVIHKTGSVCKQCCALPAMNSMTKN